ncbi:MAG: aconitase X swivel domain-containing protein [Candidatus Nitrosotenuis sp.]
MTLKVIVRGKASGSVLKTEIPINFLGSVDKKTGVINDDKHDLTGKSLKGTILVFPHGVGSSVGAYTIYSLKSNETAPVAMICKKVDLTVASGCALANIPLVIVDEQQYDKLQNGTRVTVDTEAGTIL